MYRVGQKTGPFLKCITPVYDDVGRRSIYKNVQLFIGRKTGMLADAIFKHSLHTVSYTHLTLPTKRIV